MTTFGSRAVRCSSCGTTSSHGLLTSSNEFGSRDLDGRPAPGLRHTMGAWLQKCPGCLRCASDLEEVEPTAQSAVGTEAYRRQIEDPGQSSLANQFLCRAMLDEASGAPYAAGGSLLRAAWVCDDDGKEDAARRCRSRAADLLGTLPVRRAAAPAELAVLRVDLLRRSGRFDHARTVLAEARTLEIEPDYFRQILGYQETLVAGGDTSPHTIIEAVEWDEANRVAAFLQDARRQGISDVDVIVRALRHQDDGVRKWAVGRRDALAAAARSGQLSPQHVSVLVDAVRQPDTAWRAAEVLAEAGLATERLLEAVGADVTVSPGPRFHIEALAEVLLPHAVAMARGAGAVEAARHAARSAHPKVRELAGRILQAGESSPEFAALCAELQSPQPRVRAAAVVKLHRTEKPEALDLVMRALREDPAPEVRRDAALRLGLRWDRGVAQCLLDALVSERDDATRPMIAEALAAQLKMKESREHEAELADLRARVAALAAKEPPGMVAEILRNGLAGTQRYFR